MSGWSVEYSGKLIDSGRFKKGKGEWWMAGSALGTFFLVENRV